MGNVRNDLAARAANVVLAILLLALAVALIIVLGVAIGVIDEGMMHEMNIFESEPPEGRDYWRWKAIKEALPSWILCGSIWLSLFGFTLYLTYRNGRKLFR